MYTYVLACQVVKMLKKLSFATKLFEALPQKGKIVFLLIFFISQRFTMDAKSKATIHMYF